ERAVTVLVRLGKPVLDERLLRRRELVHGEDAVAVRVGLPEEALHPLGELAHLELAVAVLVEVLDELRRIMCHATLALRSGLERSRRRALRHVRGARVAAGAGARGERKRREGRNQGPADGCGTHYEVSFVHPVRRSPSPAPYGASKNVVIIDRCALSSPEVL